MSAELPPGFELDAPPSAEHPPLPPGFQLDGGAAPAPVASAPRPNTAAVVSNAAYGGAAAIPDSLLNTPNRLLNLGKAAFGTAATAAGKPEWAPDLTPDPNLVQGALEKIGLIKPGVNPQGFQRMLDTLVRGGVAGGLTGGASLPGVAAGTGMGAMASTASKMVEDAAKKRGASDSQAEALGAAIGMAGPGIVAKLGGGLRNPSPDAKLLDREGVKMTPGQILGGGWHKAEDALSSIPFLGDVIKSRQRAGLESFGTAAMNRALAPVGEKLPDGLKGNDAIAHVEKTINGKYEQALGTMTSHMDQPPGGSLTAPTLRGDLGAMLGKAQAKLPPERYAELERLIQHEVVDEFKRSSTPGEVAGQKVKQIESLLSKTASDMGLSNNYHDRQMADFVREAKDAVHNSLYRGGNAPEKVQDLEAADKGWANFKRLQRASSSVAADKGVFTPAQLHNAAKAGDRSKDKAQFAKGGALMQDLTGAGKSRLSQSVPDSGTARRVAMEALATGGAGAAHLLSPGTAAAGIGGMAMYSPPVQAALQKLLMGKLGGTLDAAALRSVVPLSATMQDNPN